MKKIKSTVNYTVPNWNFCNNDNLLIGGDMQNDTCRFCIKTRAGHRCVLYDQPLKTDGEFIYKVRDCCRATAGFASSIDEAPQAPAIQPKELIKQTIELYTKTVNDLMKQGYPQPIAETAAKKHLLGG